jgi:hypothetical protein
MKQIKIIVDGDKVSMDAVGFQGSACQAPTELLRRAIAGEVVLSTPKAGTGAAKVAQVVEQKNG